MADGSYTIDELAVLSGVPSRTIRFYQAKDVLPKPERRGRVALYDDDHVARLRTIAELQDRGLRLRAIRDLLDGASRTDVSLSEWLGVGAKLQQPWSEDAPALMTEAEVEALIAGRPPGSLAALVRSGMLERQEGLPVMFLVRSPSLLHIAMRLDDAGIGLETSAEAERIIRRRMSRAADELVRFFSGELTIATSTDPNSVETALDALRPLSADAVRLIFAQEIERSLRHFLTHGPKPPSRPRGAANR